MIDNERTVVAVERIVDRPRYLERIRPFMDVPVMKILTGVRRCGKSTLLDMLADEVVAKNPGASMVRLNLESSEGLSIRTAPALMEHLAARLPDKRARAYVFLDEVQQVPGWEDVVNALRVDWSCDLYLTSRAGSLSSRSGPCPSGSSSSCTAHTAFPVPKPGNSSSTISSWVDSHS